MIDQLCKREVFENLQPYTKFREKDEAVIKLEQMIDSMVAQEAELTAMCREYLTTEEVNGCLMYLTKVFNTLTDVYMNGCVVI